MATKTPTKTPPKPPSNQLLKIIPLKQPDPPQPKPEKVEEKVEEILENQIDIPEEDSPAIFQAVGIILGTVNFLEDGRATVAIASREGPIEYPLMYAGRHKRSYDALKKEIEATGDRTQRLIVYPKITHFPKRDELHRIGFQVVGFDKGREPNALSTQLNDLEFRLCGLWQFIPVCQTPCISVFKNFTRDRLDFIKAADAIKKVRFMKASHVPLMWRDGPVKPFRFNPKATKEEQGRAAFVEVKARFMPGRDVFGFVEILKEPSEPPKFLKASKADKATALKDLKERRKNEPPREEVAAKSTPINEVVKTDKPKKILPPIKKVVES